MSVTTRTLTTRTLRDRIGELLRRELVENEFEVLPSVQSIDEGGRIKLLVIDEDANCFRVTVEKV